MKPYTFHKKPSSSSSLFVHLKLVTLLETFVFLLLVHVAVAGLQLQQKQQEFNYQQQLQQQQRLHHQQQQQQQYGSRSQYSGKMYFAIAATSSGQIYSRAFNKTLANITQSYLTGKSNVVTYNISLETLVIELPETGIFSSTFLQSVCDRFEDKHVVAVLVVGNSRAAFTVALAAGHAGIPVLWARGTNTFLPGFNNLVSHTIYSKFSIIRVCFTY